MKKYFVRLRNKQYGPATIEELKRMGIDRNTLVWYKGLPQWTAADQIPEIRAALFGNAGTSSSTSSFGQAGRQQQQRKRQTSIDDIVNDYAGKEQGPGKLKLVVFIAVIAVAGGVIMYNQTNKNLNNPTPSPVTADTTVKQTTTENTTSDAMRTPKEIEAARPEKFINIEASLNNTTISGTLISTATVTTYKNIVLTIYYLDAAGTNLDIGEYTITDKLKPGRSVNFSFKPKLPEGASTINTSFSEAEVEK
jgi:hypothetical protein